MVVAVQSYLLARARGLLVCLVTQRLDDALLTHRVRLAPGKQSGLQQTSDVMADKIVSIDRERVVRVIGRLKQDQLEFLDMSMLFTLGVLDP